MINSKSNRIYWKFFLLGVVFLVFTSCETKKTTPLETKNKSFNYSIDTTNIPKDTIDFKNQNVSQINGIYYYNNELYSGIVYKELKGFKVKTYSSVLNGKLHGEYRSYYENGNLYEIRNYKNNTSSGKQFGYWKNSNILKFEYNYFNNKKEGLQKCWYANGNIAYIYNYKNDNQDGFQKAWRLNGSLYRNFEVKNGVRYGFQRSKSCYEISDGEIQTKI
ncbi:hypothetical protein N9V96_01255 [Polaribacter sp.]|nr:hypothetical protein [Polaribacter sp.]